MTASDPALLELWESARMASPPARLRLLLGQARPDASDTARDRFNIAACDFALLELRRRLFGPLMAAHLDCPHCGEALEFEIDTDGFAPPPDDGAPLVAGGLRFRLPDAGDIAAAGSAASGAAAMRLLARRCCLDEGEISDAAIADWDSALETCTHAAAIRVQAACVACGAAFSEVLDVASFLWDELDARADTLFDDVHLLAGRYGWCEADILAMSAARRAAYLQRCAA
jgi:hypothetical protein